MPIKTSTASYTIMDRVTRIALMAPITGLVDHIAPYGSRVSKSPRMTSYPLLLHDFGATVVRTLGVHIPQLQEKDDEP